MHLGARGPLGGGASEQLLNSLSSKGMIPTDRLPGAPTLATAKVSTAGFAARAGGAMTSIAASAVPTSLSAFRLPEYQVPTKFISLANRYRILNRNPS